MTRRTMNAGFFGEPHIKRHQFAEPTALRRTECTSRACGVNASLWARPSTRANGVRVRAACKYCSMTLARLPAMPRMAERSNWSNCVYNLLFSEIKFLMGLPRFLVNKSCIILGIFLLSSCGKTQELTRISRTNAYELFREVNALGGLNMRATPDKQGKRVTVIPENEFVQVLSQVDKEEQVDGNTGRWVRVRYLTNEGWVFDHFLADKAVERSCLKNLNFPSVQYKAPDWKVNFSCGASDRDLLVNAAAFYRQWWRDHEGEYLDKPDRSRQREIIRNIRQDLKIAERKGNIALVNRTRTIMDYTTFVTNADVWILKDGFWVFFEETKGAGKTFFADINYDNLPDIISEAGCCDTLTVKILVGHETEYLHKVFEKHFLGFRDYVLIPEKCEKFALRGQLVPEMKNAEFRFNCTSNKIIQIR
jgi:Bacterial SH3 domain